MTNLNNKKFGVEIEFVNASTREVAEAINAAGVAAHLEGYNHTTRRHWKVTTDCTVTTGGYSLGTGEGFGGEVVSPVLEGDAGLAELKAVLDAMNAVNRMGVDVRCGLHVHFSWDGMTASHIKNIVKRYADFETEIDAWMPNSRRANNSRWCASVSNERSDFSLSGMLAYQGESLDGLSNAAGYRRHYNKVNLHQLKTRGIGTIEFRQHSGTTDYAKISNWIKFLAAFIDASASVVSAPIPTQYKRTRKVAFGEIRELVAQRGMELRFAGQRGYKLFDANGNELQFVSMETLESFYVDCPTEWNKAYRVATLSDAFKTWMAQFGSTELDSVFRNIPADTQDFLNTRAANFAA